MGQTTGTGVSGVSVVLFFFARLAREQGSGKKRSLSVRAPPDLAAFMEQFERRQRTISDGLVQVIAFARDAYQTLSKHTVLLSEYADEHDFTMGEAVAQLALERLREVYPEMMAFMEERQGRGGKKP